MEHTGSMRSRYSSSSTLAYSFGPGPVTPVVKGLLIANVAMYVVSRVAPEIILPLGLVPQQVIEHLRVWQVFTYMFLHADMWHLIFNLGQDRIHTPDKHATVPGMITATHKLLSSGFIRLFLEALHHIDRIIVITI